MVIILTQNAFENQSLASFESTVVVFFYTSELFLCVSSDLFWMVVFPSLDGGVEYQNVCQSFSM